MISADVKANKNNNKKNLVAVSYKFLKEIPPKLEIQCKNDMYFSFDYGCYSVHLDIAIKNGGSGCAVSVIGIRDCRQITFVMLNGFYSLSKKKKPTPLVLNRQYQKMDRIPAKIKCKIHATFILTKFYNT